MRDQCSSKTSGAGRAWCHLSRKVAIWLPRKQNPMSDGARLVHSIISMIEWIRTSRMSIKKSLSSGCGTAACALTDYPKVDMLHPQYKSVDFWGGRSTISFAMWRGRRSQRIFSVRWRSLRKTRSCTHLCLQRERDLY